MVTLMKTEPLTIVRLGGMAVAVTGAPPLLHAPAYSCCLLLAQEPL
jgi:hypothetical protein